MADKGKWFKLHIGWDDDPHIDALSLEDQARWCKFATYMKEHGTEGKITLISPARVLQNKFQLIGFDEVLKVLQKFPNLIVGEKQNSVVSGVTNVTVTFKNWHKYQDDFSRDRTRKWRERVTAKKRGEEKRREEKRFIAPSLKEIEEFSKGEDLSLDCSKFFNFYESKNWMVGRTKMKDWKAAARLSAKSWGSLNADVEKTKGIPSWMRTSKTTS